MPSKPTPLIRLAQPNDAPQISELYYETIHQVNTQDYSAEQINKWAPTLRPNQYWASRQSRLVVYVACLEQKVIGFAELNTTNPVGYIDCFYCHKDFQRFGIGTALINRLFQVASQLKIPKLTAHVSLTAVPFFEHHQFQILQKQNVDIQGVSLTNFVMERVLPD